MHSRVLQSCGLYPEKYSVVVWYDLLPTSSVVRVCWLNFGLLTLSLSSFPFYFLQYRAWNRLIYRGYKVPSHLLPTLCFAGIVSIANEVKGSSRCTKSYRGCDGRLRKWQFRYRGCDGRLRKWQFLYRGCDWCLCKLQFNYSCLDGVLCMWQFHYRGCDDGLRKWQFHFGKCDSRFAQETTLISQVADVFCSVFKPWFPIAKAPLTPGRWRFTVCELILDGKTTVQMMMWEYSCFCIIGKL